MNSTSEIWIAEDDRSLRWVMEKAISREGIEVRSFENGDDLLVALQSSLPEIIISDIRMPGIDGLELLKQIHSTRPDIPVIITTAHSDLDSAVAAYQGGAFEYLPKPFDLDELVDVARRGVTFAREQKPQDLPRDAPPSQEIIGEAPAMQEVFRAIGRLSNSNITVLINGESGTGKELVAHALHKHSPRRNSKFIALNMAAIPHDLIESELFGHEKGAFTGAAQRREGRFEQANGGTLFLDEIGDMPPEAQTRLLRVLADGEFYRVGGHTSVKVDVRIIAATHQNLEELVENNRFREDLYHRINVIRVHLPKLSDRREDIPQLMTHFFHRAAKELEMEPKLLSQQAEDFFCAMEWPGNVRQLENICRWLTVMAAGREVLLTDLPPELKAEDAGSELRVQGDWQQMLRRWSERELKSGRRDILAQAIPDFERTMIETALAHTSGRKKDAAELLGWGRNTLTRKLQEYQMENQAL
ncbi:nitrogen regulation protein NR(I) [Porticoccaceae bacterium]|nr:nitrogen regulation protein NR(I) [Porticoccaceae bacterium]MDC1512504.1 nitrogen regulation protein NR(I) [Porticoccaceae bacterium]